MLRILSAVLTGCLEQLRESRLTFVPAREWTILLLLLLLVVDGPLVLFGGASKLIVVVKAPVSVVAARKAARRLIGRTRVFSARTGVESVRVVISAIAGSMLLLTVDGRHVFGAFKIR